MEIIVETFDKYDFILHFSFVYVIINTSSYIIGDVMVNKLFKQMLLTQILSSMTVMLCMLVDSMMIGHFLGIDSMTAYGLSSPILLVFAALGCMISAGVQVVCGKTMGSGDKKGTNACYTASVVIIGAIALIGVAGVLLFTDQICILLGAGQPTPDNNVFFLTRDYLRGFIIGAPAFLVCQVMVPYMQISGNRTRLVVAVALMTVGDIIFDFLNVFLFKAGTFGMGLASSVSYFIAFFIGIVYFIRRSCVFKFKIKLLKISVCGKLAKAGIPTLINQISLVFLTLLLNKMLLGVGGNIAVAAYSTISTAGNICYSFSSGIAAVALTLSSIFYTDEDRSALRMTVKSMTMFGVSICGIVTIIVLAAAKPMVMMFLENPAAKDIAIEGFRIFVLSLVPCALNTCFKNYYQGIDHAKLSMTISVLQNFALTALSAFVLSRFAGIRGVWFGFITGECLTFLIVSIYVFYKNGEVSVSAKSYSLIPDDFGVKEENCLEFSITEPDKVKDASESSFEFCKDRGISNKMSSLIALCIEEMGNNITQHGFKKSNKEYIIDIRVMIKEGSPILRIRDNCENFDPVKYLELHRDDDDPTEHIGIKMVMKIVKSANYVNSIGLNNLTLTM